MRWKIIGRPRMQKHFMPHKVFYCAKLSNKQSAKVIYKLDKLRTSHSKRQKSHMNIEKLTSASAFNYIVFRVYHRLTSCKDNATTLIMHGFKMTLHSIPISLTLKLDKELYYCFMAKVINCREVQNITA